MNIWWDCRRRDYECISMQRNKSDKIIARFTVVITWVYCIRVTRKRWEKYRYSSLILPLGLELRKDRYTRMSVTWNCCLWTKPNNQLPWVLERYLGLHFLHCSSLYFSPFALLHDALNFSPFQKIVALKWFLGCWIIPFAKLSSIYLQSALSLDRKRIFNLR